MPRVPRHLSALALTSCLLPLAGCTIGTPERAPQAESGSAETPSASTPATEPLEITIAAAGDLLFHSPVNDNAALNAAAAGEGRAFDYRPQFAEISPLLTEADAAFCHLETPISWDNVNISTPGPYLIFNTPREAAMSIKEAGYDACDFASNHTLDQGLDGISATEDGVRTAGLGYAGPTMSKLDAGKAEMVDAGKATIGYLAYSYTLPNAGDVTYDIPEDAPWLAQAHWPTMEAEGILKHAQQARDDGADFVVVYLHWGLEYNQMPTDQQMDLAHDLLNSDLVDVVLGSHAHVIQPCEKINGKHVIYGMGNSISNQGPSQLAELPPSSQDGMIAQVTLKRAADGSVTSDFAYQPTWVDIDAGHIIRRVSPETNPDSWARTTQAVDALGGCDAKTISG
ncbi:CapA family protein [Corynebacterium uterequi]|uniref:Putative enzyme of poly-gamma-glutamate biosynthesis (Capsule formation) n=1 Tax=Corynebacterium uterequi TaxID=1072256 RepID=A0A0G3HKA5_9CORY|nr:CapA family protein [Corynebacterium uterequi]AKK11582.1 putative enzyme of poly-gamma-glutamate biosynthesis (capsule formation) [Corynebacterium uterequi]